MLGHLKQIQSIKFWYTYLREFYTVEKISPVGIQCRGDEIIAIFFCRFMTQEFWKARVAHLKWERCKYMVVMYFISAQQLLVESYPLETKFHPRYLWSDVVNRYYVIALAKEHSVQSDVVRILQKVELDVHELTRIFVYEMWLWMDVTGGLC